MRKSWGRRQLDSARTGSEAFELTDKVLYLYTPDGFGHSKRAAKAESALGVSETARNWNTVIKLLSTAGVA